MRVRRDYESCRFNTQPPEGGWIYQWQPSKSATVSTHSRPKAAGLFCFGFSFFFKVSTHSRPKAAGIKIDLVATKTTFQHTAARRRLDTKTSYR